MGGICLIHRQYFTFFNIGQDYWGRKLSTDAYREYKLYRRAAAFIDV